MLNLDPHVLLGIVVRTVFIYLVVLLGVRAIGKREIGQLTPFELVFLLLISNAVQNAMTGPDTSVTGGIVAAVTLIAMTSLISLLFFRSLKFRHWVGGVPTVLVSQGRMVIEHLEKEKLSVEELNQALREHGVMRVEDVELAVLEIDGSVSIIRTEDLKPEAKSRARRNLRFTRNKS